MLASLRPNSNNFGRMAFIGASWSNFIADGHVFKAERHQRRRESHRSPLNRIFSREAFYYSQSLPIQKTRLNGPSLSSASKIRGSASDQMAISGSGSRPLRRALSSPSTATCPAIHLSPEARHARMDGCSGDSRLKLLLFLRCLNYYGHSGGRVAILK